MRVAIDAAGRLVVPKQLRDEFGVRSATELELVAVDGRIEISVPDLPARVDAGSAFPVFATEDQAVPPLGVDHVRAVLERVRR